MSRLTIAILCCILPFAFGAGGGGGHAAASNQVVSSESVHGGVVQYGGDERVEVGANFSVSCVLRAALPLKWTVNGTPVTTEAGYHIWSGVNKSSGMARRANSGLRVGGLTVYGAREGHGGVYRCTSSSAGGHELRVVGSRAADDLKILPPNGKATFDCNTTKSDGTQRQVDWYLGVELLESDDEITIMENGTMVIDPVTEEHVGTYECKARNNEVLRTVTAIIFTYKKMPKSQTAIEGDKHTLTCEVEGVPRPTVTWTKDNNSLVEEMGAERVEFKTDEDNTRAPANGTVIISDIKPEDRGTYKCVIHTEALTKETETFIRVKDIYAALWPFLGIVVEVVVLCLIIFIYEKRRTKNDFEESDTDQGNCGKGGN